MCKSCVGEIFGIETFYRSAMSRGGFLAASAAAAGVAAAAPRLARAAQPARIFYGGPIVTMDGATR
ncbi:MAG TPA: hypothetical protein VN909_05390, partial [Candidatus Dormibacteraeota bacterium]|nr:hypothetical protein [Candidatus Dormibacteraeota bacterium]